MLGDLMAVARTRGKECGFVWEAEAKTHGAEKMLGEAKMLGEEKMHGVARMRGARVARMHGEAKMLGPRVVRKVGGKMAKASGSDNDCSLSTVQRRQRKTLLEIEFFVSLYI